MKAFSLQPVLIRSPLGTFHEWRTLGSTLRELPYSARFPRNSLFPVAFLRALASDVYGREPTRGPITSCGGGGSPPQTFPSTCRVAGIPVLPSRVAKRARRGAGAYPFSPLLINF